MVNRSRLSSSTVRASDDSDFDLYCEEAAVTLVLCFLSKDSIPRILDDSRKNQKLFLTCCLILSWKLQNETSKVAKFLKRDKLEFSRDDLSAMGKRICGTLDKRYQMVKPCRFIDFFAPLVDIPQNFSHAPSICLLINKSQNDMGTRLTMPVVMEVSVKSISNEFPNQPKDFESDPVRGFFHLDFQDVINTCQKKLAPPYEAAAPFHRRPGKESAAATVECGFDELANFQERYKVGYQVRILYKRSSMKTSVFFYFFCMFVDFTWPPSRSSMLSLYKVLLRSESDAAFTQFSPSIKVACAMQIFISKEYPDQLKDFKTNVIKRYFYPGLRGTIKKCLEKLVPLYRDISSSTSDPSSSSILMDFKKKESGSSNSPPNSTIDSRYQIRDTSKRSSSSEESANTTRLNLHRNPTSFFDDVEFCCPKDVILYPYNQKKTNSCYAITVITTMFADMCLNNRSQQACEASAQQLVDSLYRVKDKSKVADPQEWQDSLSNAVAGPQGRPDSLSNAFNYVKEDGLFSRQKYPWESTCQPAPTIESFDHSQELKIYIDGMGEIPNSDDHQAVMTQLRIQPIAGMIVACPSFLNVKEEIFAGATDIDLKLMEVAKRNGLVSTPYHAVTLIGYGGRIGVDDFYLCQNSYGKGFGKDGLFKIRRKAVGGFCWPFGTRWEIEGTNQPTDPMDID